MLLRRTVRISTMTGKSRRRSLTSTALMVFPQFLRLLVSGRVGRADRGGQVVVVGVVAGGSPVLAAHRRVAAIAKFNIIANHEGRAIARSLCLHREGY